MDRLLAPPLLLDGGMGRELRFRGVEIPETIWSANALLVAPDIVRQIHADYIAAGADVITTNTYGVIRADLAKAGIAERFAELNLLACQLAAEARDGVGLLFEKEVYSLFANPAAEPTLAALLARRGLTKADVELAERMVKEYA